MSVDAMWELRRLLKVGGRVEVTNHYITREDHPCYGTRIRTVTSVNGSSFYLDGSRVPWPRAANVSFAPTGERGRVKVFGHPTDADLFLTISEAHTRLKG